MAQRRNENRVGSLALAVASGQSVATWARENEVPERTCRDWTALPAFKATVKEHRGRLIDEALGKLAAAIGKAVAEIGDLLENASSEHVQLSAARSILSELVNIQNHAELEALVTELEKCLEESNRRL